MKKLTLNKIDKLLSTPNGDPHIIPFEIDGEMINIEIKPYLALQEISDIVDTAANAAFPDGLYAPEYKDSVLKYKIIDTMTNIPTLKNKESINLLKYNELYDKLELRHKIMCINDYMRRLIMNLESMTNDKVEFQKHLVVHANRNDELMDAILSFLNKTTESVESINGVVKGLDAQTLRAAIEKISNGSIDFSQLARLLPKSSTADNKIETSQTEA